MARNNRVEILGVYDVELDGLGSYFFSEPFLEIPYIEMARQEIEERPEMHSSLYYQYLSKRTEDGIVFRKLTPEERFKEWRELAESIRQGWQETFLEYEQEFDGVPLLYGGLTALMTEDSLRLVDGHHRLSLLTALGAKGANIKLFITRE